MEEGGRWEGQNFQQLKKVQRLEEDEEEEEEGDDLRRERGPSRFNECITCNLLRHVERDWTGIFVGHVKQIS
jgi:hypothetical protein